MPTRSEAASTSPHRGGPPGFLRLGADGRLWLPDYAGNRLFNTLGNLLQDPRCGLLFIDFDNGDLLHLHAEAELFWPGSQPSIPGPPAPSACWRCAPQAGAGGVAACRWHSASPAIPFSSCR